MRILLAGNPVLRALANSSAGSLAALPAPPEYREALRQILVPALTRAAPAP